MKKFINELSFKKSFRIVAFFIGIIGIVFGGVTLCKIIFDTNPGQYWDGTVATAFNSGNGTQANPYKITNAAEFAYLQTGCTNNVYIQLQNDIYLNKGYIEYINDEYKISIEDNEYTIDPTTGKYYQGTTQKGQLVNYVTNTGNTSCHIDGNNHKVFGLYITSETSSSFLHHFTGSIDDLYIQSGLINGVSATFIDYISNSSVENVYFDGVLNSTGTSEEYESINLFSQIKSESLGSSNTIDFSVSSQYAESNYNSSSGYAYRPGVYQLSSDENVYFYRGNVTNNNIIFGGFCWKIVRTTSTQGIRLIYNGTPNNGQCNSTGSNTMIGNSAFNSTSNNSKYVGYTYAGTSWGGNIVNDSKIKNTVETWFGNNLTEFSRFIEDSPYCNDISTTQYNNTAIGIANVDRSTWYAPSIRSSEETINVAPSLNCSSANSYSISGSIGNGKLSSPVGLITSDEVILAGATSLYSNYEVEKTSDKANNTTYYLYNGSSYWTMSPNRYMSSLSYVNAVSGTSRPEAKDVKTSLGVRPVITLNSEASIEKGTGTANNPYVLVITEAEEQNLLDYVISQEATDSNIVTDIENNGVRNIRYIGADPNNYICVGGTTSNCTDGELYRMIGIFNDDVHGQTGKQLIKAARSVPFNREMKFDGKGMNVGSRDGTGELSPEWADAQLMYMLNGTHYVNSGYKKGSSVPVYNTVNNNGQISDGNTTFYIVNGSYYDGGGNVNKPNNVQTGGTYSPSTINIPGLNEKGRSFVQEVKWNTARIDVDNWYDSAQELYIIENSPNSISTRADYWKGKIGLISVTDFLYATSGGKSNKTRANCLAVGASESYTSSYSEFTSLAYHCEEANWLSVDKEYAYYFITQAEGSWEKDTGEYIFGWDALNLYILGEYWFITGLDYAEYNYTIMPALYLKNDIVFTIGNGTKNQPYLLSFPSEGSGTGSGSGSQTGYAALIGNSNNTQYNLVKSSGTMKSDSSASGLLYKSSGDTVTNFQVNSNLISLNANLFVGNVSNNSTLSYGHFDGNVNASTTTVKTDPALTYNRVFVYSDSSINITNECNASNDANKVFQSVDSSNACYKTKQQIMSLENSNFNSTYWKIETNKIPELKVSGDVVNPYVTLDVKNLQNNNTTSYNSSKSNLDAIHVNGDFSFNISYLQDDTAVKSIEYIISSTKIENVATATYQHLPKNMTITDRGIFIIYLKVTDINNNVTYINTDYIINISFNRDRKKDSSNISSGSTINDVTRITDNYTLNSFNESMNNLYIKVNNIPLGTVISFIQNNNLYQYTSNGGESYIPLTAFKKDGTNQNAYFEEEANIPIMFNYDFSNTHGGTFDVSLVYKIGNTDVILTSGTHVLTIGNVGTIGLTNSIGTKSLNSETSYNISYNATTTDQSGFHYLVLSLLNNNNGKLNVPTMDGLSVTYNNKKYYANNDREIIIPIGNFTSTISLKLNVEKLTNVLLMGDYKIGAILYNEYSTSPISTFNVSFNYMSKHIIDNCFVVDENIQSKTLNRSTNNMTLNFNIKSNLNGTIYENDNFTTKIALTKMESLASYNYSIVNLNNYLTTIGQLSNGSNNLYPIGPTISGNTNNMYNLYFKNTMDSGAYRLEVRYYSGSSEIKRDYVYFIVK